MNFQNKLIYSFLGLIFAVSTTSSQHSRKLKYLVDSISDVKPTLLKLPTEKGFMAVERVYLSKNGKTLYYGVRNGYESKSIAEIRKINFAKKKWTNSLKIFKDSSGAPALTCNDKTMLFQYDHPSIPKGLFSTESKKGWTKPKEFIRKLKKSHYLQSPKKDIY